MTRAIVSYVEHGGNHGILVVDHDVPPLNATAAMGYSHENQQRYARRVIGAYELKFGSMALNDDGHEIPYTDAFTSMIVWDDSLVGYIPVDLTAL